MFDSVNGEFASQAYAKDQLAKFFSTARLDSPVAMFALETRIRLLHDFTTDAGALKTTIEKYRPTAQNANTESIESRASPFITYGNYHTNERNILTTLEQMDALAKILSHYPGRKNLIWVSESFPLNLFPETVLSAGVNASDVERGPNGAPQKSAPNTFANMVSGSAFQDYAAMVKRVAEAMLNAQVAVYPVDAAGVGKNARLASQHTANDLAQQTGGRAFHNANNLAASMHAIVSDGSAYYTLSYYPENKNWDGQFRTIEVKAARGAVSLRHRLGYYALDPEKDGSLAEKRVAEDFSRSLLLDSPAATSVRFQAGVVPPSAQSKNKVVVNFAVDPHTLQFERGADGTQHGKIVCVVWAYAKDKKQPFTSPGGESKADLKAEVFEQMLERNYPCKQELELKPGTYTLKLGVLDRNSNRMGTTSTSLTVQ